MAPSGKKDCSTLSFRKGDGQVDAPGRRVVGAKRENKRENPHCPPISCGRGTLGPWAAVFPPGPLQIWRRALVEVKPFLVSENERHSIKSGISTCCQPQRRGASFARRALGEE